MAFRGAAVINSRMHVRTSENAEKIGNYIWLDLWEPCQVNWTRSPICSPSEERKERERRARKGRSDSGGKKRLTFLLIFILSTFSAEKNNTSTQDATFLTLFSKIQADIYWWKAPSLQLNWLVWLSLDSPGSTNNYLKCTKLTKYSTFFNVSMPYENISWETWETAFSSP